MMMVLISYKLRKRVKPSLSDLVARELAHSWLNIGAAAISCRAPSRTPADAAIVSGNHVSGAK
jgi:hypothetical protein